MTRDHDQRSERGVLTPLALEVDRDIAMLAGGPGHRVVLRFALPGLIGGHRF